MTIGLFSFLVFLFIVYKLSKDDFVFLRKNVTLEQVFNTAFFGIFVCLFIARLGFVIEHFNWQLINPFVFFSLVSSPGFSASFGIVGGIVYLLFYTHNKKLPFSRFVDMFAVGLLFTQGIFNILSGISSLLAKQMSGGSEILSGVLALVGYGLLYSIFKTEKWRDGAVGYFSLFLGALLMIVAQIFAELLQRKLLFTWELFASAVVMVLFLILYLNQQYFQLKGRHA
ncbi:MAG TPA: prolipoprotein diacylglyceryl transferase family protein [Patescibacteria group bacterium]|nr:prolipoprotein diacylglyceryl transferase family protein [Patescibacteria group bacterium]